MPFHFNQDYSAAAALNFVATRQTHREFDNPGRNRKLPGPEGIDDMVKPPLSGRVFRVSQIACED